MDLTQEDAIAFRAQLTKVTTLIDGGWRITLDVAHNDVKEVLKLAELRDLVLQVVVLKSKVG